ncbi:hypothetical protein E5288_WYG013487 [Bos mutus]|uniref:Uncharacterized protein n=1 Tax=Bos mutus TaxID=72004 RepID=A0A6B0SAL3_9CETA|nr:hypothetical protein [Bos mutus]
MEKQERDFQNEATPFTKGYFYFGFLFSVPFAAVASLHSLTRASSGTPADPSRYTKISRDLLREETGAGIGWATLLSHRFSLLNVQQGSRGEARLHKP